MESTVQYEILNLTHIKCNSLLGYLRAIFQLQKLHNVKKANVSLQLYHSVL